MDNEPKKEPLAHPHQPLIQHLGETAWHAVQQLMHLGCTDEYALALANDGGRFHDVGKATRPFYNGMRLVEAKKDVKDLPWLPHGPYGAYGMLMYLIDRKVIRSLQGVLPHIDLLYLIYRHHTGFSETYSEFQVRMQQVASYFINGGAPPKFKKGCWLTKAPAECPLRSNYGLGVGCGEEDRMLVVYEPYVVQVMKYLRRHKNVPRAILSQALSSHPFRSYVAVRAAMAAIGYGDIMDTAGFSQKDLHPLDPTRMRTRLLEHRETLRRAAQNSDKKVVQLRNELFDRCLDFQDTGEQFLLLNAPTGGAKTLAALALACAIKAKQIVYGLPFLSIVGQVTGLLRDLQLVSPQDLVKTFGVEVLEHVSVPSEEYVLDDEDKKQRALLLQDDNLSPLLQWNHPIIATTLERISRNLCGHRRMDALRMLSLYFKDTVVIVDECQVIPPPKLYAYLRLLEHLGARVILMSATTGGAIETLKSADISFTDVAPAGTLPVLASRRRFVWKELANGPDLRRFKGKQVLSVYSTKRWARAAFETVRGLDGAFLIDTNECSLHRLRMLEEIKRRLKSGAPVILVATPAVEAGVDLDFPRGYRMFAPLASIIQTAGRINREGKMGRPGVLTVWWPKHRDNETPFVQAATSEMYLRSTMLVDLVLAAQSQGASFGCDKALHKLEMLLAEKERLTAEDRKSIDDIFRKHRHHQASTDPDRSRSIEDFQLIPQDELVQALVDYKGTFALAKAGNLTRPQFNLRTIEAKPPEWWKAAKKTALTVWDTVTFKGESKPSKVCFHLGPYDPDTGIDID